MSEDKPDHKCASSNARYRTNVIPDDAYSPTIEIGNDGSLTLVVGGTGMTRPVTEWFKAMEVQSGTIPRAWWDRLRAHYSTAREHWEELRKDYAKRGQGEHLETADSERRICEEILSRMKRIERGE